MDQPRPLFSFYRKLINNIITSPLIQLYFFLFHFRMTIAHSPGSAQTDCHEEWERKQPSGLAQQPDKEGAARQVVEDESSGLTLGLSLPQELPWHVLGSARPSPKQMGSRNMPIVLSFMA